MTMGEAKKGVGAPNEDEGYEGKGLATWGSPLCDAPTRSSLEVPGSATADDFGSALTRVSAKWRHMSNAGNSVWKEAPQSCFPHRFIVS